MSAKFVRIPLTAAALFIVGCGGSDEVPGPTGTLTGKVTLDGKAVPAETSVVLQHTKTGRLFYGQTNSDGEFEVNKPTRKLPVGPYEVSIQQKISEKDPTEGMEPLLDQAQAAAAAAAAPVSIPAKYRDAAQSGLGFEIEPGENERPLKLKRD